MNISPWGNITGIRPIKIVRNMLNEGLSPIDAKIKFMNDFNVSEEKSSLAVDIALREIKMLKDIKSNDICIYIGIPFCKTRCLYCSFITAESGTSCEMIEPFVEALIKEIDFTGDLVKQLNLNIVSLYIGGGTPTILTEKYLTIIIERCKIAFGCENLAEFTVEAGRPDTIDKNKLKALKDGGVTRISINPQSMNDSTLKSIGRMHSADDIRKAFFLSRNYGFNNINMDVIAGLPFEGETEFIYTLNEVEKLGPESVTVHTMSVKRGSKLHEVLGSFALSDDKTVGNMVDFALDFMSEKGKYPYYLYRQKNMLGNLENVGYSKPGFECLYNVLIMEEISTIISLGGGGVTKVVNTQTGSINRIFNVKEPRDYIERIDEMINRKKFIEKYI